MNRRKRTEAPLRVLIVGGGIASLTLALCLGRRGHASVIVERSAGARDAGYMIDFFGSGYDAAERLALIGALEAIHYSIPTLSFLRPDGRPRFQISYEEMRRLLFDNRHFNFMRGDLERVLREKLTRSATLRFGVSIEYYEERKDYIVAHLTDGAIEKVDLLVGADGVHSCVRSLAFGKASRYIRYLGYHTAAYLLDDRELSQRMGQTFATVTLPGCQVAVYPIRSGGLATFWVHRADGSIRDASPRAALRELRRLYEGIDWLVPRLLAGAETVENIYFDDVCQVEIPSWNRGRVVLLGDACACVSLLAGQGASMAMGSACILAGELDAAREDLSLGMARYEQQVKPAVLRKQRAGRNLASWFVPESKLRLALRDAVLRWSSSSYGAWLVKRQIAGESVLRQS